MLKNVRHQFCRSYPPSIRVDVHSQFCEWSGCCRVSSHICCRRIFGKDSLRCAPPCSREEGHDNRWRNSFDCDEHETAVFLAVDIADGEVPLRLSLVSHEINAVPEPGSDTDEMAEDPLADFFVNTLSKIKGVSTLFFL